MDASPVKGFPKSRVRLLDSDQNVVAALNKNGIDAVCDDVKDYRPPEKHDLLILINPSVSTRDAAHSLKVEGWF